MEILTPDRIKTTLFERLLKTQKVFESINVNKEDNIDVVQSVYFKYYFDFSTAIESTITSIMAIKYPDDFAQKKMKIIDPSCSNYLNQEEIKYLINTDGINDTICDLKTFFSGFVGIIKDGFYNQIGLEKKINDYESFLSFYKTSRDTRNKIAHGLINEQVRYDNTILIKFMLSFYVLHKFHLRLFEGTNTEGGEK